MRSMFLVITIAVLFAAPVANAIVCRHDVPDSMYVTDVSSWPALVHINLPTKKGIPDCEGTLIAPRWVLTAAHVGVEVKPGHRVSVGGTDVAVDSVIIHPEWNEGPHDLALLRLASAVSNVAPAALYRGSGEVDQIIDVIGYGDTGTGLTGPQKNDGLVRAATNRVDAASDHWLKFAFDAPDSARVTEREGISGPGDSGGPAFLVDATGEVIVGVSSGQSTRGAEGPGHYGVVEFYTRVSRYIDWIESVTTGPVK